MAYKVSGEWLEVSVEVEAEIAEAVAEVFSRYAYHRGVVVEAGPGGWSAGPVVVRAYLSTDDELKRRQRRVEEALWHLGQIQPIPEPAFRTVAEAEWADLWKKQLRVLRVGQRLVIRPSWLEYVPKSEDVVIQLDPGMAFGTGLHPTTQLCLLALEEDVQSGIDVLDLGTGSGILAIAAAKLGAESVLAIDSDPQAVDVARENVVINGVEGRVKVAYGSLSDVTGCYDLMMVNIVARVIEDMVREGLATRLRLGGKVVTAGIVADQEPSVAATLDQGGLTLVGRRQKEDWVSLLAKKVSP